MSYHNWKTVEKILRDGEFTARIFEMPSGDWRWDISSGNVIITVLDYSFNNDETDEFEARYKAEQAVKLLQKLRYDLDILFHVTPDEPEEKKEQEDDEQEPF